MISENGNPRKVIGYGLATGNQPASPPAVPAYEQEPDDEESPF